MEVTLVRGWKSRPSLAMANSTRGIGNIEPSRLERQTQTGSVNDHLNSLSTRPAPLLFNLEADWLKDLQHLYADFSVISSCFIVRQKNEKQNFHQSNLRKQ